MNDRCTKECTVTFICMNMNVANSSYLSEIEEKSDISKQTEVVGDIDMPSISHSI